MFIEIRNYRIYVVEYLCERAYTVGPFKNEQEALGYIDEVEKVEDYHNDSY